MKILFNSRDNLFDNIGGDTIQILKTREYLERLGLSIDINVPFSTKKYDLIHFFNTTGRFNDIYNKCKKYKSYGYPIVLSPIYWDSKIIWKYYNGYNFKSRFKIYLNRYLSSLMNFIDNKQMSLMKLADILLPNSIIEKELLIKKFGLSKNKFHIVYNAVDKMFFNASAEHFLDKYGYNNFLLYCGRIEPRKNTHSLLKAINDTDLMLIIIGQYSTKDGYFSHCKKIANNNVEFMGHMSQKELISAYAAANTHVLPSFYETPGLSSLEAAAAGCNIVSTNVGSPQEYFHDLAYYCDPGDIDSIKYAILKSYGKNKNNNLRNLVMKYSWENAAKETLKAYNNILNKN
ncbi:MAG: glycosyltransferase [Methanobacteriaceae archaeon]|nr:glycosyltransferase [Methanobacteriaceae archaeon]